MFSQVIGGAKFKSRSLRTAAANQKENEQVMQVSVISDYAQCLKMTQKLKLVAGKYKRCIQLNEEHANNAESCRPADFWDEKEAAVTGEQTTRVKYWKRSCCRKVEECDAEEHYRQQVEELREKIQKEEAAQSSCNTGVCFVVFRDGGLAKQMLDI